MFLTSETLSGDRLAAIAAGLKRAGQTDTYRTLITGSTVTGCLAADAWSLATAC